MVEQQHRLVGMKTFFELSDQFLLSRSEIDRFNFSSCFALGACIDCYIVGKPQGTKGNNHGETDCSRRHAVSGLAAEPALASGYSLPVGMSHASCSLSDLFYLSWTLRKQLSVCYFLT